MLKAISRLSAILIISSLVLSPVGFTQNIQSEISIEKPVNKMSVPEINKFLDSLKQKSFIEKLEIISDREKGTPYFLGPLGEGSQSKYDKNPFIDLSRVDCVTFLEQTLALSLSNNYDQAFNTLQKIRYKNADKRIEKRNHYFMADWVVNNSWLVHDVSKEVGGEYTIPLTKTISHKTFFANSLYKGIKAEENDRTITINYIPKEKLSLITNNLKSGDIAAFVINLPGIFVSHTGFIIKDKSGNIFFRNATSIGPKQVSDLPYDKLTDYLKNSKKNLGLVFIRPDFK